MLIRLHSKKFLGPRQENSEVRNGKLQFSYSRPTFGPIWINFTCFRSTFGPIWTILPVSDKNLSELDQKFVWNRKIAFSHFGPQHFPVGVPQFFFFECTIPPFCWYQMYVLVPFKFQTLFAYQFSDHQINSNHKIFSKAEKTIFLNRNEDWNFEIKKIFEKIFFKLVLFLLWKKCVRKLYMINFSTPSF